MGYTPEREPWNPGIRLCNVGYVTGDGRTQIALRLEESLLAEVDSRTREGINRTERIRSLLRKGIDCSRGQCRASQQLHAERERDTPPVERSHPAPAVEVGEGNPWLQ